MSLVDKQFLEQLKSRLWHLMQTGEFSDVTFQFGEEQLHCHKNILASACPYFHSMFTSHVTGQDTKVIPIKTMPLDIFRTIIQYIYTGEIAISHDNAQSILEAADMMDFSALMTQCTDFMIEEMDPSNCLGMWQAAKVMNAKHLEEVSYLMALEKFMSVCEEEEFLYLDRDSLVTYLSDTSIEAPSEDYICSQALKWMDQDVKERIHHFAKILPKLQLQNLSAHFIQYTLLKHDDLIGHTEILNLLHDLLKHVVFLAPLPSAIVPSFPRLKTDLVNGILLLSKETEHIAGTRETKTKLGFYRFADRDNLVLTKPEDMMIRFDDQTMVVALDTWLFLSNDVGMHKYDMPTKHWALCTSTMGSRYKLVLGEGKQLFGIEYSHYKCPISRYIIEENKWEKMAQLKFPLIGHDFAAFESRGILFIFGGNERHEGCIQAFDTNKSEAHVLKITLPSVITHVICKRYKDKVLLLGKENCFIYDIDDLHKALEYAQKFSQRPKSLQPTGNGESLEAQPEHPEVHVVTKEGIARTCFCAELLGDQLVIMAGLSYHPRFVKNMVAVDINEMIQDEGHKVIGWRTVGQLTNDKSPIAVSSYKSAIASFKQN